MKNKKKAPPAESLYREAGVDLDKANALVTRIKPLVRSTFHGGVITDIGGFCGLYSLDCDKVGMRNPVLVSSTDGVGTKLKVAFMSGRHDTVGIDLVAMCVNDIIVQGARPLFFLDYIAMGRLDLDVIEEIISGIVAGCKTANCSLVGGETAELPGFFVEGDYDLVGFVVGLVDNSEIVDGATIHVGNQIIGLASSGLHSNGYSLARRIVFEQLGLKSDSYVEDLGRTVADELLEPTRIYVDPVLTIRRQFNITGMAHITGGGFHDNLPRILPKACQAMIYEGSWRTPPVFRFLQEGGEVSSSEMYRVFNNGIGYVMIVKAEDTDEIIARLQAMGQAAYCIGEIMPRPENAPPVIMVSPHV